MLKMIDKVNTTVIHEVAPVDGNPGYILEAVVKNNIDNTKTFSLYSTVPGAKHPDPYQLCNLTIPKEAYSKLIKMLEFHA